MSDRRQNNSADASTDKSRKIFRILFYTLPPLVILSILLFVWITPPRPVVAKDKGSAATTATPEGAAAPGKKAPATVAASGEPTVFDEADGAVDDTQGDAPSLLDDDAVDDGEPTDVPPAEDETGDTDDEGGADEGDADDGATDDAGTPDEGGDASGDDTPAADGADAGDAGGDEEDDDDGIGEIDLGDLG